MTRERTWTLDQKPSREGLKGISLSAANADKQIIGNKKSNIYHLPNGCPSYDKVARINQVPFSSQKEAETAGYRLAETADEVNSSSFSRIKAFSILRGCC